jgi:hypothetical protein
VRVDIRVRVDICVRVCNICDGRTDADYRERETSGVREALRNAGMCVNIYIQNSGMCVNIYIHKCINTCACR